MLGVALLAAMSVTHTIRAMIDAAPEPIVSIDAPAPTPPLPPRTQPPPRADAPTSFESFTLPPMEPAAALAQDPISFSPGPVLIERPHWARRPRDLAAYFPRRALSLGVEGQVELDCLVSTQGALDCAIISETPLNWGFGAAALRISRDYRMLSARQDGGPVQGRYRMQVPFRLAN
jgi:protein TonB